MSEPRRYFLVMYDVAKGQKNITTAMKKTLDPDDARVLLQEDNATITTDRGKFVVVDRRLFETTDLIADKPIKTLYIICDVERRKL